MNGGCSYESQVLRAARDDRWTSLLRDHVRSCEECTAAVVINPWLLRFSEIEDRERPLPDPAVLLLKARLLKATSVAERAALPITRMQAAAYIVIGGCWAALFAWEWSAIEAWINGLALPHLLRGDLNSHTLSISFFLTVFLLSSATVGLALHTILAED